MEKEKIYVSVQVKASRAFSSISKSADYLDPSSTGDCKSSPDHAVAIVDIDSNNLVTIVNSWGKGWGDNGFKKIKACSATNLYGDGGRLSHI